MDEAGQQAAATAARPARPAGSDERLWPAAAAHPALQTQVDVADDATNERVVADNAMNERLVADTTTNERLMADATTNERLVADTTTNERLVLALRQFEEEKRQTAKTIAMLEFNNQHNKNKVLNMELSNKDLQEKITKLWQEKNDLMHQLREGSSGIHQALNEEKERLQQQLLLQREQLEEQHRTQTQVLQEQLEGLTEIKLSYEKQISQIEVNNADMHSKIGTVQLERDAAKSEVASLNSFNLQLQEKVGDLTGAREALQHQVAMLEVTVAELEVKVEETEVQSQETIHTLQNNLVNLQKQVQGLKETSTKLALDLESESKLRLDAQAQLSQLRQLQRQLDEARLSDAAKINELQSKNEELEATVVCLKERQVHQNKGQETTVTTLKEQQTCENEKQEATVTLKERQSENEFLKELKAHVAQLESEKTTLMEKLSSITSTAAASTSDNSVNTTAEQVDEKTRTNVSEDVTRLKDLLKTKDEENKRIRESLQDAQHRLRLSEVISGEVEEQRKRVRELESSLTSLQEQHRQQLRALELETQRQVASKEQQCQQTISSAYDQQDTETSELVRQHRQTLQEATATARHKAAALDTVVIDYQTKLKYEEQLAALAAQHEHHIKQVEATWKVRAEKMVRQREAQLLDQKDDLTTEWNKERRELERLTQVAAAAFRNGTESVELLKKQVAAQRRELEEVKLNYGKEIGELKALLEVKRRSRGGGGGGVRLGVSLEEAAEFEYLKNILYQYMLGKETQTLSKVLCAVVKFDAQQQQEIFEHEEQRQNLLQVEIERTTLHPSLLQEDDRSDPSKTL
ncbi:hypothetical protein OTU49_004613 [Cherax quadricarinatus]